MTRTESISGQVEAKMQAVIQQITSLSGVLPGGAIEIRDEGWRPAEILVTPRIGIRHCADWPLRFVAPSLLRSK